MRIAALLLLIACEKTGAVESSPGSSTTPTEPPPPPPRIADAAVATLPSDAAAKVVADAPLDDEYAFAEMLTAEGPGVPDGDMSARRPGTDLGRQLDDLKASGRNVVVGKGPGRVPGPTGRISVARKQALDDTTLAVDVVLRKIQSVYVHGIKRCYQSYLDNDPSARGKVKLAFTVTRTGATASFKVLGFAKEVDECVGNLLRAWRFPVPKTKDGAAVEAAFEIDLVMVPD